MIRVLRAAAQFSDDTGQQIEYNQAADALDRVLTASERHSDAPTRDAFAYALGRAELDLGDKLTELIEVSKDTHIRMQDVQSAQREQGAAAGALWAAFQSFAESLTQWREEIEHWRGQVDATLATYAATLANFARSRDQSVQERTQLRTDMDDSKQHRTHLQQTLDTRLPAIEAAIKDLNERHGDQIDQIARELHEIKDLLELTDPREAGS